MTTLMDIITNKQRLIDLRKNAILFPIRKRSGLLPLPGMDYIEYHETEVSFYYRTSQALKNIMDATGVKDLFRNMRPI